MKARMTRGFSKRVGAPVLPFLLPLALAACGSGAEGNLDTLDKELTATNASDPALMSALQDQIMVDPQLAAQANKDAIRPPVNPYAAPMPAENVATNGNPSAADGDLMKTPAPVEGKCEQCEAARQTVTLGALASRQKDPKVRGCAAGMQYSARWASRLPDDLPLHPQARVVEAAGSTAGDCALRAVSFTAPVPMQTMLDWYFTKASKGGYSAEHRAEGREHMLGGTRDRDGAAYVVFLTARGDGATEVDFVANNGS